MMKRHAAMAMLNTFSTVILVVLKTSAMTNAEEFEYPRVTSISPHTGSTEGGTRLYIFGSGFSSSGNLGAPGESADLGNKAYLISDSQNVTCDVEDDSSHETMIVCYTRPMRENQPYFIQVTVDGYVVPFEENCNRQPRGGYCQIIPRWYKTPHISSAHVEQAGVQYPLQTSYSPGSLVRLEGRIFTQIFGSNNQTNSNGRTVSIRRAYVRGQTCDLLSEPDVFYGLQLTSGDTGFVTCKPTSTYIGPQNFTMLLTEDFGRAYVDNSLRKINGRNKVYNFQTYAEISSVAPTVGSLEGGTRVVIEGRYFDDTTEPIRIMIGRVPCEYIAGTLTTTRVECIAGVPPVSSEYYPGSRGIMVETWNGSLTTSDEVLSLTSGHAQYNELTTVDSTMWAWNDELDDFSAKYSGVFVAPADDSYKFMVAGDDQASLFINCEESKQNLTKVACRYSASSTYVSGTQTSYSISLIEGQECYFEALLIEHTLKGHMYVAVQRGRTTFTSAQSVDAKNEIQYINFNADYDDETQVLNFTGWSNQTGEVEVQEIVVEHPCIESAFCDNVGFRIGYGGIMSTFIPADASSSSVMSALENIPELAGEGIVVTSLKLGDNITFTVEFPEKRGDYSLLSLAKYPADVAALNISIQEVTKGVPEQRSFRLRLGVRVSPLIPEVFNEEDLQSALEATREAFCPEYLLPDSRRSTVVTTMDYEYPIHGYHYGTASTDIEPFCGRTSSMNNRYLYYAHYTAENSVERHATFDATVNKWLCLAHRGIWDEYIYLYGTFRTDTGSFSGNYAFSNPFQMHENEWRYSCINLMETITSEENFAAVIGVTLNRIELARKDQYHNYYVDALTIGSVKVTEDTDGILGSRTPPSLANGNPIEHISVTKLADEEVYTVKIDTYNCGDQLPLITMPIAGGVTGERTVAGTKPMSGSFDLTVKLNEEEYTVANISADITAEKFENRLETEVPGFGEALVHVSGSCHARDYQIQWVTNGGDKPEMEIHIQNVDGASDLSGSVSTVQDGGIVHNPISGDMLRLAYDDPQVEVFVNGYPSKCVGSCIFDTAEDATPVISGITPTSGSSHDGTVITITGSNLDVVGATSSVVTIGDSACNVTSNSATSITCVLLAGSLGTYDILLNVGGKGLARKESAATSLSFEISGSISSISPDSGFKSGGTLVTIDGYGFSVNTVFNFDTTPCQVLSFSSTEIQCRTPEHVDASEVTVTATDGVISLGTTSFTYIEADAEVTTISPVTSKLNGGGNLTITGVNIGQSDAIVMIGEKECEIIQNSLTEIICQLPTAPVGVYDVRIRYEEKGYADGPKTISYVLQVDDVSPLTASKLGGNEITITGSGFADGSTVVDIGGVSCSIQAVTDTLIECISGPVTTSHLVTNNGHHATAGTGFAWDSLVIHIEAGDTVTWQWEFPGVSGGTEYGARVLTTNSADSSVFDGNGFQSSATKSRAGTYSYTFNNEGTYLISSGKVDGDDYGVIEMKQSVIVQKAQTKSNTVSVTVAGHEADYNISGTTRRRRNACTPISILPGCTPGSPSSEVGRYEIITGDCYTPKITSLSSNQGYKDTMLTITGEGFATDDCANVVTIGKGLLGEYSCTVVSTTNNEIICQIAPEDDTPTYTAFYVHVNVHDLGESSSSIISDSDRRFSLLPSVSSISPDRGSLSGGTLLTISGSGFSADTSILVGYAACVVETVSYFEIQCRAPQSHSSGTVTVTPLYRGAMVYCSGSCNFTYDETRTPQITSITPLNVSSQDTEFTITGTSLSSDATVTIGTEDCAVTTASDTLITCTLAQLFAGSHSTAVLVTGLGYAQIEPASASIYSVPEILNLSPTEGSEEGGTEIELEGNGFACDGIEVLIGNEPCVVSNSSLTNFKLKCVTAAQSTGERYVTVRCGNGQTFSPPPLFRQGSDVTPEINSISPTQGTAATVVTLSGDFLASTQTTITIGEFECSIISESSNEIQCTLPEHAGGMYPVTGTTVPYGSIRSNILFNYQHDVTNVNPTSGSFAGGDLLTLSGKGFGSNAIVSICEEICEHGGDVEHTSSSYDTLVCKIPEISNDNPDDKACSVTVSINGQVVTAANDYTFAIDKTPRVTSIDPARGGTQGGTTVTIIGSLFDSDRSNVNVKIGGVVCDVVSSTETEIQCTTNANGQSLNADVVVTIMGKGKALSDVKFYYIDVWSSVYTWGGLSPPQAGEFLVVQSSQTLLIDIDTPILKMILIQGGVVIFDNKDIHLQSENILITDGGILQIGTEEEPFEHKAIITLHGHLRSRELPIYGTKTIGVRNGTLDLHGKHIPITWTHLAQTAEKDSNIIHLKHAVTWKVGDEIVLATTGFRHSQRENEKQVISAISSDGKQLTLESALSYTHISISETVSGVNLETHGEVGLLTRNIVIQGSIHTDWSQETIEACPEGFDTGEFATQTCFQGRFGEEEGSDQFGAQIMIHHRSPGLGIARARIEYVEFTNVGQAFRLGRYPIHFHLLGDVNFSSYVRGCAIHRSFNRAITIHNTHHLQIERNVVYDVMGGAVFIEDGIEHGNRIEYNLVVFCKQSTSLQNDDITPAAYWVTNPNNTLQHNAAAGGTHFGFWYRIHSRPDGPSYDPNICQQHHPVEKFANNTVHSQGWFGLWVFQQYIPKAGGSCWASEPAVAEFESLTVWNCEKGAELVNVGAIKFIDFLIYHNEQVGIETKRVVDGKVKFGQAGTYNSTLIAYTPELNHAVMGRGILLPITEGYEVINTKFVNFDRAGSSALGVASVHGFCNSLCGGFETHLSGIEFENTVNKFTFGWEHQIILNDLDGSVSGTGHQSLITPYNPTLPSSCTQIAGFGEAGFEGMMCNVKKFHRVAWNNPSPSSLQNKNVFISRGEEPSVIPFLQKRLTHNFGWMTTMVDGEMYDWAFENAQHLTNISYQAGFYNFKDDDCLIVSHNLTQTPDKFIIAGDSDEYNQTEMVSCAENFHGDYYFDNDTTYLYYVVSARNRALGSSSRKRRSVSGESATPGARNIAVNFQVYRCNNRDCAAPPEPSLEAPSDGRPDVVQLWHDSSTWKLIDGEYVASSAGDGTAIPSDNKNVRIESGAWVVANQDLPRMNQLWIEGVLELEWNSTNLTFTMSATHIMVMGGRLIIGWEDNPFQGLANIVLRGDHYTPDIAINGGPVVGAKAIGVIGGLDLHGTPRALLKTHLANRLLAGENTVTLQDTPSDWEADDEIVIATTSADPWETETFKIVSVSGNVVTLNDTARFDHISESFTHSVSGLNTYDIRAEVSILTRNVKIIGEDYNQLIQQSFGARVLITGAGGARGYARISDVEFYHTGQEGWIDNFDPRYSLAFLDSGDSDPLKPSYVHNSTFHNGFNTAIGVFGANNFSVSHNVIHHTVGPAIRVEGSDITVEDNLAMLVRTRTVYLDRVEKDLTGWKAAIEVTLATRPIMQENVVVGSERAGYRIRGTDCGPSADSSDNIEWGWNTARATLQGVWLNNDGYSPCTRISKFRIHAAFDDGIYYQGPGSVIVSNVLVTDSGFGVAAIINGPAATSHSFQAKSVRIESSTIVAVSRADYCPTLSSGTDYVSNSLFARASGRAGASGVVRTGVLWPAFISAQNQAPSKPFLSSKSYPAIGGRTDINGVAFVNFGDTSCSSGHTVIVTNTQIEDFLHPIYGENIEFLNSPEDTRLFFHRPSVGKVNPSDCVDMECDGMKKALFVDNDGSVIGGSGGSVIPQAEYEWGGDTRRGLGDYRIPKTLLTAINGSRIPVENIAPYKGIIRGGTCSVQDTWQAHKCTGFHHGILVIESLDADTETRRLSPVALLADQYIDLSNGPQDHGWCAGYTCQERLSTFWTIVAFSKTYELHFTSTSPEKTRFRIINEDSSTKMVLKLFCKRPQRLDVYVDNYFQAPLNYDSANELYFEPSPPDQYHPTLSDVAGSNYYDRDAQTLHITLQGGSVIEVRESQMVVISFDLPAVTPDEFFDNNIVDNLAAFLNIPRHKVRVLNVIREGTARRKKRSTETATVEVGIANTASEMAESNSNGSTVLLSSEDLDSMTARITNAVQENTFNADLGADVLGLSVVDRRTPAERNANITNSTESDSDAVTYSVPASIRIVQQPTSGYAGLVFSQVLKAVGVDAEGNDIVLGHSSDPWKATVTIVTSSDASSSVSGGEAYFNNEDNHAEFSSMTLSHAGQYTLRIQVTYPSSQSGLTVETSSISISAVGVIEVNDNNVFIIVFSIIGGLLVIGLIAFFVVKASFSVPSKPYKVTPSDIGTSSSHTEFVRSTMDVHNEAYHEEVN